MNELTPSFYSVIPAFVRYSSEVCDAAKLLYSEITALTTVTGYCWASNNHFAKLYGKDPNTISRWIAELIAAGFITSEIDQAAGNRRKLRLSAVMPVPIHESEDTPNHENRGTPIHKNVEHSIKENSTKGSIIKPTVSTELLIKKKKEAFLTKLTAWKTKHPNIYPGEFYNQFFRYWTEVNEMNEGGKLRYEAQKFFEIGKRLATFRNNVKETVFSEMWRAEERQSKSIQMNFEGNKLD